MSDFRPLQDFILVKQRIKQQTGVIQLISKEITQEADVIKVGPGFLCEQTGEKIEMTVKEGDVIMYPFGGGQVIVIDGFELLMLRERDIFGILVENTPSEEI